MTTEFNEHIEDYILRKVKEASRSNVDDALWAAMVAKVQTAPNPSLGWAWAEDIFNMWDRWDEEDAANG